MSDDVPPLELHPGEYEASRHDLAHPVPCRGCGATMAWVRLVGGAAMPLSLSKVRELPCPSCRPHGLNPDRASRPPCQRCRSTGIVYAVLNHWSDCPKRARFSRKTHKAKGASRRRPKGGA